METLKIKRLNKWANAHSYYSIDVLRIVLGIFLLFKGFTFVSDNQQLEDVMAPVSNFLGGMFALHYIVSAHIVGGILLIFGLYTRWAIWVQLPILIGAVIINLIGYFNLQNAILSTITLLVCFFFLIYGGGKNSADHYFKMEK